MAKDMLDAIYNAEEDCRQREANARAESAEGLNRQRQMPNRLCFRQRKRHRRMPICFLKRLRKRAKKSLRTPLKRQILSVTFSLGLQTKTASVLLTGLYKGSLFKTVAMKEAW